MTKKFDDNARGWWERRMDFGELNHDGTLVGDLVVKQVSAKAARPLIAKYHYSKTFPDSTLFCFAGYLNGNIAGVIVFGMGVGKNQYTALIPTIEDGEYCELTRLWSPDGMPKNTESKLISMSIKMLPKEIKLIVSFADPSRGHYGCIYQSTNFYYCGMSGSGRTMITADGRETHTRLLGIYRMRHEKYKDTPTDELMKILGYTYIEASGKHRYVMLRGTKKTRKNLLKLIEEKILPYPKPHSEKLLQNS